MPRGSAFDASAQLDVWPRWTPVAQAGFATFLAVVVAFEARPGLSVGARVALTAIPAIAWLVDVTPKRPPFLVHALASWHGAANYTRRGTSRHRSHSRQ